MIGCKKLIKATESAINNIEISIKAFLQGGKNSVRPQIWLLASDFEYLLFLLSLTQEEDNSWKSKNDLKKGEIGSYLKLAKDLLKKCKVKIQDNDYKEAYKKAWLAREYLLNVQKFLDKKKG